MSTKTARIIRELVPDVLSEDHLLSSEYIAKYWNLYKENYEGGNSLNGNIFEELIAITLVRQGILPFYKQAKVAFIPNVNYDFVIYSQGIGPIVLSAKTSLRERYKQADLEAVALKFVHRKSESYIISMSEHEVKTRRNNISDVMALDDFIYALSSDYDELLDTLSQKTVTASPTVTIVKSNDVITSENYRVRWNS